MTSDPEGPNELAPDQVEGDAAAQAASDASEEASSGSPQAAGGTASGEPAGGEVSDSTQDAADQDGGDAQAAAADKGQKSSAAAGSAASAESENAEEDEENVKKWYILKVQVNREESIRRALERRVKVAGLEEYFGETVVPTEDVAEYNKNGKRRIVKKKLYPGYIMINLVLNDDTWFLVRETPGIGDFTGSAGNPTPMEPHEVQRIVSSTRGTSG